MDEMLNDGTDQGPRKRLTPLDVQQKVFRRATLRGYHEQDVDDFLDEVTEELALLLDEVRQLRERSGQGPIPTGDPTVALRTADDIVRQAREEAADILHRARTEAAAAATAGGAQSLHPFLSQERSFLQDLSKLVQDHADAVREMARGRGNAPAPPPPSGGGHADSDTVKIGEAEPSEPAERRA